MSDPVGLKKTAPPPDTIEEWLAEPTHEPLYVGDGLVVRWDGSIAKGYIPFPGITSFGHYPRATHYFRGVRYQTAEGVQSKLAWLGPEAGAIGEITLFVTPFDVA